MFCCIKRFKSLHSQRPGHRVHTPVCRSLHHSRSQLRWVSHRRPVSPVFFPHLPAHPLSRGQPLAIGVRLNLWNKFADKP